MARIVFQVAAGYHLGQEFGISMESNDPFVYGAFLSKVKYCRELEIYEKSIDDNSLKDEIALFKTEALKLSPLHLPEYLKEPFAKMSKEGPIGPEDNYSAHTILVDSIAQRCIANNIELIIDCMENRYLWGSFNNSAKFTYFYYPAGVATTYLNEEKIYILLAEGKLLRMQRSIGKKLFPDARGLFNMQDKIENAFDKHKDFFCSELAAMQKMLLSRDMTDKELSEAINNAHNLLLTIYSSLSIGINMHFGVRFLLHAILRDIYSN